MSKKQKEESIIFCDRVLDNVHGFIYYTEAEGRIIDTLLFKRLQSIKQLSIVNWVFPGSEHTRYIHSLGVMYIADKIAEKLELTIKERKIVRLAGLLHDIGHYPLSHVCELPYDKQLESYPDKDYCKVINRKTRKDIDNLAGSPKYEFMKKRSGLHHENVGAEIVRNNEEIKKIIEQECGPEAPEIIADMIIGNVERKSTDPLLVQILHSELDADGIDYLMRDAVFSGTSFGTFELDQLIGCMCIGHYNGRRILCISPKGIAAADQYLINKFFSYSQVVYNKHIEITEWMAEQIVNWMQKHNAYFPENTKLKEWIKKPDTDQKYIDFTDNYFWASLQNMISNELVETEPKFIKLFCERLLHHSELEYVDGSEFKIVDQNMENICLELKNSKYYNGLGECDDKVGLLNVRRMSKQVPKAEFEEFLDEKKNKNDNELYEEDIQNWKERRFMECICVKEDEEEIHLLCEDKRSLMKTMYNMNLAVFRMYKFDIKDGSSVT